MFNSNQSTLFARMSVLTNLVLFTNKIIHSKYIHTLILHYGDPGPNFVNSTWY